jgi:tRNA-dihydrouridine synthase B
VPVIASGDVTTAAEGLSMIKETGCDFVMIGRAALGNPWIFRELDAAYRGLEIPAPPSDREKAEMMKRHLGMMCSLKGGSTGVKEFRKFIPRYTRGMRGAASLRRKSNEITDPEEMMRVIEEVGQIDI